MSFKPPSFQERTALAAKTKQAALAKFLAKPPVDPAVVAAQIEAEAARAAARQQAQAEKLAARAAEKAEKEARRAEAAAAAVPPPPKSEEEQKRIRDAKYAARKMKLGKR
jgi:regulator of protease activity HflC (stomatin/prohibitin superfamily)